MYDYIYTTIAETNAQMNASLASPHAERKVRDVQSEMKD